MGGLLQVHCAGSCARKCTSGPVSFGVLDVHETKMFLGLEHEKLGVKAFGGQYQNRYETKTPNCAKQIQKRRGLDDTRPCKPVAKVAEQNAFVFC